MAGESLSSYCASFNAPSSSVIIRFPNNGGNDRSRRRVWRGPPTVYVAAAAYATADGGLPNAQGPLGNGNGNIDPNEFMQLLVSALRDENAAGKYDRLDPSLDFVITQITRANGIGTLTWASVPGKTYQMENCDQLDGTWTALNGSITAHPGETLLSTGDPSGAPMRFYRVRLVGP